jgi:hypothetical protein
VPRLFGVMLLAFVATVMFVAISPKNHPSPVFAQTNPTSTPFTLGTSAAATATPTPRVIVIDRPTTSPTPRPTLIPLPTATAIPRTIVSPTATPLPTPTVTPIPTSTAPPAGPPTIAPAGVTRLTFAAEDWRGGFYRGDGLAYGRPWVAVYGALSDYPRATLNVNLDAAPADAATLTITGLDDEWAARNEMMLEVNGETIFTGPNPFLDWDGVGDGTNAAWTSVPFTIPAGLLRAGQNEITVANLTPVASFNAPPYILLADATLEIPRGGSAGGSLIPTPPAAAPQIVSSASDTATFGAENWVGGYYQGDSSFYGRPWVALYGAFSDYPRATLTFQLDTAPSGTTTLTVYGLDDELNDPNQIALEINGEQVFTGPSPFANWDGVGGGAAWTEVTFTIPASRLRAGRNEIAITNLTPAANFSAPPYVLLGDGTITAPGARVTMSR